MRTITSIYCQKGNARELQLVEMIKHNKSDAYSIILKNTPMKHMKKI